MLTYNLRDYQAYDLQLLEQKVNYLDSYKAGLILSEPRTGKSRIAIAYALNNFNFDTSFIIVCPKISIKGWYDELIKMNEYSKINMNVNIIKNTKDLNSFKDDCYNFTIINYEMFKRLTINQIKTLINYKSYKKCLLIVDELHRLRNFKTQQSQALFNFKDFLINKYDKNNFTILGLTGTPAVKDSYDVFGILSFINFSNIGFKPYYKDFNQFKEYFYNCEDTSFGKMVKSIKRQDELNYIMGIKSVQTKQRDLNIFKNYKKVYKQVKLIMDEEQKRAYDNVEQFMEYEDIDCKNNLVKYIRLQQICNDPSSLLPSYEPIAPKIKFIIKFIKHNNIKTLIISKSKIMLNSICEKFDKYNVLYSYINGDRSYSIRTNEINKFKLNENVKVILLQLDTCKESLTLPEAECTIFIDRSFIQGFNEQAEARMTPINGLPTTKFIIDLVMKNSIEEKIYNILVHRKQNIKDVNVLFK